MPFILWQATSLGGTFASQELDLKIMADLFSSVLKAKIKEMGFMTDTMIGQPNDKMTSYIHLYCISMMYG